MSGFAGDVFGCIGARARPYQAPKEYVDRYPDIADPTRRTYAGMVACLDDNIGRVVAALDKKGLRDNTLIVFHSDNGGTRNAMFSGVMADVSKIKIPCDNGPYREGKGTLFEGACRVCACANWPGHIKPGSTVDGMIHAVDLYPTLAALAGASTAKCKPLDGLNVWDTIAEGKPSPRTEIVYNIEPFRAALRQGDWKLIWRTLLPSSVDLYDLAQDPSEQNNLAAANPEKVAAMQERLNALAKEAAKPLFLEAQFKVIMHGMHGEPGTCPQTKALVTTTFIPEFQGSVDRHSIALGSSLGFGLAWCNVTRYVVDGVTV